MSTHIFLGLSFLSNFEIMLKGKHVHLRALEEEDLKILKNWRNSDFVRVTTREYLFLNMINQKNWFESIHKDNPPKFIIGIHFPDVTIFLIIFLLILYSIIWGAKAIHVYKL